MSQVPARWDDLVVRLITSGFLMAVGVLAIWLGGNWFLALAAAVSGVMVWELFTMVAPQRRRSAMGVAILTGLALALARLLPPGLALPVIGGSVIAATSLLREHRALFAAFAFGILLAGYGLTSFRDDSGVVWLFWLVIVVAATDVFGYFAGRQIGGPKFWPKASPKKTWAGILAGWAAAGAVGALFVAITTAGASLILISVAISFASQMGDIAESMVKRRMQVKDSSALLPGHGGLWDRFDGLLGASLLMLLVAQVVPLPVVAF